MTPIEILAARYLIGKARGRLIVYAEMAALLGVSNKLYQRWETAEGSRNHRPINPDAERALRQMLADAGVPATALALDVVRRQSRRA